MKSSWIGPLSFFIVASVVTLQGVSAETPEELDNPLVAKLNSATIVLNKGYGKLSFLLDRVSAKMGLNVVCDQEVRLKSYKYSIDISKSWNVHKLLKQSLKKSRFQYEGFANVIYITRSSNPSRHPPLIEMDDANAEARDLLSEEVSISLSDETLKESLEILADVTGLELDIPSKKDQEFGRLKPDLSRKLNLTVEDIPARSVLILIMRQLQLATTIQGSKVIFWSYALNKSSANSQKISKALNEPCQFKITCKTLGELAQQIRKEYKFLVYLPESLSEHPIQMPPEGLRLRSMLYLAPGIQSGIDHSIVGDALVFEKRKGRRRPALAIDTKNAETTLLIALQTRRLPLSARGDKLEAICAKLDKSFGSIKVICDKTVAGRLVNFETKGLRLGAVLEHIARVTNTHLTYKDTTVRFVANP
jgi:hypothetical protein